MGKASDSGDQSSAPQQVPVDQEAAAEYVAEMLLSLRQVATRAELLFLTYLLEVAREEAAAVASGEEPTRLIS